MRRQLSPLPESRSHDAARKADTAAGWLEDVNAKRDTVIKVIDVKPYHPETSGTH